MTELKRILSEQGAALVGYADIEGLYNDCDIKNAKGEVQSPHPPSVPRYPRGIAIAVAIPGEVIAGIHQAPTVPYYDAYNSLNKQLNLLAEFCASYLTEKGYKAYAQTTAATKQYEGYVTVMPHKTVAVNGGLGWIGKCALLVTPQYGSAVRLTSVLTDAPLPVDTRIEKSRCGSCQVCQNVCPAQAVTGELWRTGQSREQIYHAPACRKKAREIAAEVLGMEITLCGKCIEACPYTQKYING